VAETLMIADIQQACDQLAAIHDLTDAKDGYVSLELPPALSFDAAGSVAKAKELWTKVDRRNVMIKVPGTPEGVQAFEDLTAAGINVNVTLLFAVGAYEAVANAYVRGLERRTAAGGALTQASVASFFVSRIDALVDSLLAERAKAATDAAQRERIEAAQGSVAIANAKVAYARYQGIFSGPRWQALAAKGARPQRLLWASTSTKNPAYRDVLYVEELIGPDTVNTLPDATVKAYLDHGFARPSLLEDVAEAEATIAGLNALGLDYDAITSKLLADGVKLFADAYDGMVHSIAARQQALQPAATGG
jgi:transaldolase/glucose-6-phosphate isomerase